MSIVLSSSLTMETLQRQDKSGRWVLTGPCKLYKWDQLHGISLPALRALHYTKIQLYLEQFEDITIFFYFYRLVTTHWTLSILSQFQWPVPQNSHPAAISMWTVAALSMLMAHRSVSQCNQKLNLNLYYLWACFFCKKGIHFQFSFPQCRVISSLLGMEK